MANKKISELTPATALVGTEEFAIVQGGVTKKVAVSELGSTTLNALTDTNLASPTNGQSLTYDTASGKWINSTVAGGGKCVFFKSLLTAGTAVTTNGVDTYVDSIFIPAGTIQVGDIVELRYSCAKSGGTSIAVPRAWLSNTLGALTEVFATGFVATNTNAKILVKRSYIIETNTRTFCVNRNQDAFNSDEDPSIGVRSFIDMGVSFATDLYLDFSIANSATGNSTRIDFAYIKVYRE